MTVRVAIADTGKSKSVAQYLPSNYQVLGRTLDNTGTITYCHFRINRSNDKCIRLLR